MPAAILSYLRNWNSNSRGTQLRLRPPVEMLKENIHTGPQTCCKQFHTATPVCNKNTEEMFHLFSVICVLENCSCQSDTKSMNSLLAAVSVESRPSSTTECPRKKSTGGGGKEANLKELQGFIAEIEETVHTTTTTTSAYFLHQSQLWAGAAKRTPLLKELTWLFKKCLLEGMWETQTSGRRFSVSADAQLMQWQLDKVE